MSITVKKSFIRFLKVFAIAGSVLALTIPTPTEFSFSELSKYLYAVIIALLIGGISGILKFVSGFIKYDQHGK